MYILGIHLIYFMFAAIIFSALTSQSYADYQYYINTINVLFKYSFNVISIH
jgi:hypothetical protein